MSSVTTGSSAPTFSPSIGVMLTVLANAEIASLDAFGAVEHGITFSSEAWHAEVHMNVQAPGSC